VDISALDHIDAGVRVGELTLPRNVTAVVDPEDLVVKLTPRREAELEEEPAAAEPALLEAEPGAEPEDQRE
jgi:hypothetical protein